MKPEPDERASLLSIVEASGALLSAPGSRDVLPTILEMAARLIAADAYAVWRRQEDAGTWKLLASYGLSDRYERILSSKGAPQVTMPDQPFYVEDVETHPLVKYRAPMYRAEGIRAMLTVPLRIEGETAGTIVFYHRRARSFGEDEMKVAAALGNLAAAALGTAELYDRQRVLRESAEAAERRSAFLAEAGAVLSSSLDYEATLNQIAELAVPAIADWAMVDIVEGGDVKRVAVKHSDPRKAAAVAEAYAEYSPPPAAPSRVALRTGKSQLMEEISDDLLVALISRKEHLDFARQLGLKSFITAPMVSRGNVLGLLTFVTAESGRRYTQTDLHIAEELARRGASAVENAKLYEQIRASEERYRNTALQLRAQQRELASVLSNIPDVICRYGSDLRFRFSSAAVERHTGQKPEFFTGKTHVEAGLPPDLCQRFDASLKRVFATGAAENVDFTFEGPQGRRNYSAVAVPEFAPDGTVESVLTITRDVTEARHAEAELRATNQELRRANEDLNQFAYSASHDLQEPLRMVAIYSQMLSRKYAGKLDDMADEYIQYTVAGAQRMELLVRDLLAYTQAVNTKDVPQQPVDTDEIMRGVIANLRGGIDQSGAEIVVDPLPRVRLNEAHLLQLFQNLLSNAIKYRSEHPPRIHVRAQRQKDAWLFSVADNGIGIAPQYHEQVFGLFRRLYSAAELPGTGIGLALCKKIVERYGGRIWVDSEPGRGATFLFTVPD